MRIRGLGRAKKTYHRLRRRFKPGAIIVMYHRVVDLETDPYALAVTPERFAQHLDYLCRACRPMRLIDLVDALQKNGLPDRAVAITFDDGYVDNFAHAYPLLQAVQLPATIFVTSGMIGSAREFWWDDLERLLILPPHLPAHLQLTVNGQAHEWSIGSRADREKVCGDSYRLMRPLSPADRERALDALADWAGLPRAGRTGYRAVTTAELEALADSGLIDIGGHTQHHPQLSSLTVDDQTHEIVEGRQRLEELIGRPIKTFAYPYGDFTDATADIVRAAGFHGAVTVRHGSVEPGDDLFRLRRCAVSNWDINTFAKTVDSFFFARD